MFIGSQVLGFPSDFPQFLLHLALLLLQFLEFLHHGAFLAADLLPPGEQLHVDAEEAATVEPEVALLVTVEIALAFVVEEVAEGDEDAGVGGAGEVVVGAGAERAHGGREVHVGVEEWRYGAATGTDGMEEYLVVFLVVATLKDADELVVVGLDGDGLVGPHQAVAVGEVLAIEIEYEVASFAVEVAIHGNLAEEIACLGDFEDEASEAVPEVIEAVEALAEVVAGLVGGLDEGAAEFDGIGQVVVDELFAELVLVGGGSDNGAIVAAHHVAAVDETVGTDNLLVLGAPHKELLAAVGVFEGVVHIDVHLLARAAAVDGEAELAQTPDLPHDIGREVGGGDVYLLVATIAHAKEMFLLQFLLDELAVDGRCYVG